MRLFQGNADHFCPVCQENADNMLYHRLRCGHELHFDCVYQMVIHGRHYQCPMCRDEFTEDWIREYESFIQNEADSRNENQLLQTRKSHLREHWNRMRQNDMANQEFQPAMIEPPPLVPQPQEEVFHIDDQGNWVLQIGPDENFAPMNPQDGMQNDLQPEDMFEWRPLTPPPTPPRVRENHVPMDTPPSLWSSPSANESETRPLPSSLIPNRRAAVQRRHQRERLEQDQNRLQNDREADDERESTSNSE